MLQSIVIGNLGADALLREENGQKFVTFRVAHSTRFTRQSGEVVEQTVWVNCLLNGDGGNLLQYLKKGTAVCVVGESSLRVYSSEKERRMLAGMDLRVRSVELIGGKADVVPSRLYDKLGVEHRVNKFYLVDCWNPAEHGGVAFSRSGEQYTVDTNGWATPSQVTPASSAEVGEKAGEASPGNNPGSLF